MARDIVKTDIDFAFKTEIDVFELKTNRWRRVRETHYSRPALKEGTFYKRAFYWVARRLLEGYENVSRMIVSFNLKAKKFKEVELPSQVGTINLKVIEGYLFAIYHDIHGALQRCG